MEEEKQPLVQVTFALILRILNLFCWLKSHTLGLEIQSLDINCVSRVKCFPSLWRIQCASIWKLNENGAIFIDLLYPECEHRFRNIKKQFASIISMESNICRVHNGVDPIHSPSLL